MISEVLISSLALLYIVHGYFTEFSGSGFCHSVELGNSIKMTLAELR